MHQFYFLVIILFGNDISFMNQKYIRYLIHIMYVGFSLVLGLPSLYHYLFRDWSKILFSTQELTKPVFNDVWFKIQYRITIYYWMGIYIKYIIYMGHEKIGWNPDNLNNLLMIVRYVTQAQPWHPSLPPKGSSSQAASDVQLDDMESLEADAKTMVDEYQKSRKALQ